MTSSILEAPAVEGSMFRQATLSLPEDAMFQVSVATHHCCYWLLEPETAHIVHLEPPPSPNVHMERGRVQAQNPLIY